MRPLPPEFELLVVPYDSGAAEWRMGRGPLHLLPAVEGFLDERGAAHRLTRIEPDGAARGEIAVTFSLWRALSEAVSESRHRSRFPLVLSGNCGATVGAVAGLGPDGLGIAWLDAHGDFNSPETTRSGFLDGMCAAVLAGRCWTGLASSIPGFSAIDGGRLRLCGTRDLDAPEARLLESAGVRYVGPDELRGTGIAGGARRIANELARVSDRLYIHVDMDVHDPLAVPANTYQPPGGLDAVEVRELTAEMASALPLAGLTVAAFDPALDPRDRGRPAVRGLLEALWA